MKKRDFLSLSLGASVVSLLGVRSTYSQTPVPTMEIEGPLPPLPPDLQPFAQDNPAPFVETTVVGTGKPLPEEIDSAFNILIASPFDCQPLDVANFFLQLGRGDLGPDFQKYAREWPQRANPVIFHFFSATRTQPAGDTTAWCAAFMNWCLLRSRAKSIDEIGKAPGFFSRTGKSFSNENLQRYSSNSASSGSFRCWRRTDNPELGDLVVMANRGTEGMTSSCLGQGHVAFFQELLSDGRVKMLGGNQSSPGSGGAVTLGKEGIGPNSRFYAFVKTRA